MSNTWASEHYCRIAFCVILLLASCLGSCYAIVINTDQQYFIKSNGGRGSCSGEGGALYMAYLNKTCNAGTVGSTHGPTAGPLLRDSINGKTTSMFTLKEVGKTAQNEVLVEIKTSYPKSSQKKPLCQGYVVPEKKDACNVLTEPLAAKVHIHAKVGDTWILSSVDGKPDTYTIRSYSRKAGCLKYLAAPAACAETYLQLEAKDDGSGRHHWTIAPVNASLPSSPDQSPPSPTVVVVTPSPPPPPSVVLPAQPYQLSVTSSAAANAVIISWKDGTTAASPVEETYQVRCVSAGGTCSSTPIASSAAGIARGVQVARVLNIPLLNSPLACYVVAVTPVSNSEVCSDPLTLTPPGQPQNVYGIDITKNSWWASWEDGKPGYPEELYSVKCVQAGASCNDPAIAFTGIVPRGFRQANITNLPDDFFLSCYVIAYNGIGSVCSSESRVFLPKAPSQIEGNTPSGPITYAYLVLKTGTSYSIPANTVGVKIWAIGGGGGGSGINTIDGEAGGGGGAGGVAVTEWNSGSLGSTVVSYTLGAYGPGGSAGPNSGTGGGTTTVTYQSTTLIANGGGGGTYDSGVNAPGGTASGGTVNVNGGQGAGATGDAGGGSGGAIGGVDGTQNGNDGTDGAQSADISDLRAAIEAASYSWTAGGVPGVHIVSDDGDAGPATGFGCGGGSADFYGGNGGAGLFGGAGGGAASGGLAHIGGDGGNGVVVIRTNN